MSNRFKNYNNNKSSSSYLNSKKKKEFCMNKNDYPELCSNNNTITNNISSDNNSNFANAILKPIPEENPNDLQPGWISIKLINNKFHYKYGPSLYKNKNMNLNDDNSLHPNILMDNITTKIIENRERYINQYNITNGAYAYEDLYQNCYINESSD